MKSSRRLLLTASCVGVVLLCWWFTISSDPGEFDIFDRWSHPLFLFDLVVSYGAIWALRGIWASDRRRVVLEAMAVSFSLGLFVVLAELPALVLGVDYAQVLSTGDAARFVREHASENPNNHPDEELGFRHRPESSFSGQVEGDLVRLYGIATDRRYQVDVAYDRNGFRNAKFLDQADIIVIGDSYIEAGLVPHEETLAMRIGATLGQSVLNLGVSGYGPEQERIVLERYGLPAKPKLVLWFFFEGNDLIDTGRFLFLKEQRKTRTVHKRRFRERSFIANALWVLAVHSQKPLSRDKEAARDRYCRYERAAEPDRRDVYFAYDGDQEEAIEYFEETAKQILEAKSLSEEAGAEFVLIYSPVKLRILREFCEFQAGSLIESWRPDDLPEVMAEFARKERINYVDLIPALTASARAGRSPYFPDDGHWNSFAHEIVSDVVVERLGEMIEP